MKKILFFLFFVIFCTNIFPNYRITRAENFYENNINTQSIRTYAITKPVMDRTKIYVKPELVNFIQSTGREILKEEEKFLIFNILIHHP